MGQELLGGCSWSQKLPAHTTGQQTTQPPGRTCSDPRAPDRTLSTQEQLPALILAGRRLYRSLGQNVLEAQLPVNLCPSPASMAQAPSPGAPPAPPGARTLPPFPPGLTHRRTTLSGRMQLTRKTCTPMKRRRTSRQSPTGA